MLRAMNSTVKNVLEAASGGSLLCGVLAARVTDDLSTRLYSSYSRKARWRVSIRFRMARHNFDVGVICEAQSGRTSAQHTKPRLSTFPSTSSQLGDLAGCNICVGIVRLHPIEIESINFTRTNFLKRARLRVPNNLIRTRSKEHIMWWRHLLFSHQGTKCRVDY